MVIFNRSVTFWRSEYDFGRIAQCDAAPLVSLSLDIDREKAFVVLVLPGFHLGVKPTHVGAFEIHQVAFVFRHGVWLVGALFLVETKGYCFATIPKCGAKKDAYRR